MRNRLPVADPVVTGEGIHWHQKGGVCATDPAAAWVEGLASTAPVPVPNPTTVPNSNTTASRRNGRSDARTRRPVMIPPLMWLQGDQPPAPSDVSSAGLQQLSEPGPQLSERGVELPDRADLQPGSQTFPRACTVATWAIMSSAGSAVDPWDAAPDPRVNILSVEMPPVMSA